MRKSLSCPRYPVPVGGQYRLDQQRWPEADVSRGALRCRGALMGSRPGLAGRLLGDAQDAVAQGSTLMPVVQRGLLNDVQQGVHEEDVPRAGPAWPVNDPGALLDVAGVAQAGECQPSSRSRRSSSSMCLPLSSRC